MPEGGKPENLINWKDVDEETKAEWRRRGGLKSSQVRREKKLFKEVLNELLDKGLHEGVITDLDDIEGISQLKDKNITVRTAISLKMIERASKGNVNAYIAIRDTVGEMPVNNVNINHTEPVTIINDLPKKEEK